MQDISESVPGQFDDAPEEDSPMNPIPSETY